MKTRASKAGGMFTCSQPGSFELIVHMEADPFVESFAAFSFETILPNRFADELASTAAFVLRHRVGQFVVCTHRQRSLQCPTFASALGQADRALAGIGIWLLTTTPARLRREPRWSQARELARCARQEIDPADRERVVEYLGRRGPAPIAQCARLCSRSSDSFDAIYSLVAAGIVYMDSADTPLSARTLYLDPPISPATSAENTWLSRSL
jgi:hypothetical protein